MGSGAIDLPGDPTSVALAGDRALVAVVTREDPDGDGPQNEFDAPTGDLLVFDLASREIIHTIPLAGQPDSVAVSPSGAYAAVAIENERDEEENGGLIPQAPGGSLQIVDLTGEPAEWGLRTVDLAGLAEVAPDDPEVEYVDINELDQGVVSLQENNHLVIVDLASGEVVNHFSAGAVDVPAIDTTQDEVGPQGNGLIELTGALEDKRLEPDAVAWIDDDSFATANEGDYEDADGAEGGSRTFSIFNADGTLEFDAGNSLEHAIVRIGHHPESRSDAKGAEPEGLEVGAIDGTTYLFVAAERADVVAVYDVSGETPQLVQILPTGIGPEGLTLTDGGILAVTSEVDGAADGFAVRPIITLFSTEGAADWTYPQLISGDDPDGLPIPWVAMSGFAGDPADAGSIWAVSDSILGQAWLYRIDVTSSPATVTERIAIGGTNVDRSAHR